MVAVLVRSFAFLGWFEEYSVTGWFFLWASGSHCQERKRKTYRTMGGRDIFGRQDGTVGGVQIVSMRCTRTARAHRALHFARLAHTWRRAH